MEGPDVAPRMKKILPDYFLFRCEAGGGRRLSRLSRLALSFSLALFIAGACVESDKEDGDTGSKGMSQDEEKICGLNFEDSILPFFEDYCLRCHSETKVGAARNDAPEGVDYDTLEDVLDQGTRIRERLLDGPSLMPPSEPIPTQMERDDIIAWIDCALD